MDIKIRDQIFDLLAGHRIMTIATLRPDGWPQATTVGYINDGLDLYFLCGPDSQKAANLARDDRVSITIDHDTPDVMAITGLSMAGRARPVTERTQKQALMQRLIERYPEQKIEPGQVPPPEAVSIFHVGPEVISVLDYSKGFGHTELVRV